MIEFEHYKIQPLLITDLIPFFEMVERNRKRLENFFTGTVSKTKNLESTQVFLQEIDEKRNNKQYYPYIIIDTTNNNFISFIDLKNIDWSIPKTEIGCYTDEHYAAKGITTKALQLFVDYAFKEFKFRKIFLRTHHSNNPAIAIAQKCGFELEGTIRMDYKTTSGEIVDLLYYGKLNTVL